MFVHIFPVTVNWMKIISTWLMLTSWLRYQLLSTNMEIFILVNQSSLSHAPFVFPSFHQSCHDEEDEDGEVKSFEVGLICNCQSPW